MPTDAASRHDINALFKDFEHRFPANWREDKWYLTLVGALIGSGKPFHVGDLYKYLIAQPAYTTPQQRQHLVRRMREAMIKCIILNGIPIIFQALLSVAELEREEDKDYTFTREGWKCDDANRERGLAVLRFLYRDDHAKIMDKYAAHKDLPFVSTEISYGLFLADHQILDLLESELVILPAILCQDLAGPAMWHLRGCVRAGISPEDTELIHQASEMVASFAGKTLHVNRVTDIKDEMHSG